MTYNNEDGPIYSMLTGKNAPSTFILTGVPNAYPFDLGYNGWNGTSYVPLYINGKKFSERPAGDYYFNGLTSVIDGQGDSAPSTTSCESCCDSNNCWIPGYFKFQIQYDFTGNFVQGVGGGPGLYWALTMSGRVYAYTLDNSSDDPSNPQALPTTGWKVSSSADAPPGAGDTVLNLVFTAY